MIIANPDGFIRPEKVRVFSKFWLVFSACAIALAWLIINHHLPWLAFHSDAWISLVLVVLVFSFTLLNRNGFPIYGIVVWVCFASLLPIVQFASGVLVYKGDAWISSIYLFGFATAMAIGSREIQVSQNQLPDLLFMAIGVASIATGGVVLAQWLGLAADLPIDNVWLMGANAGERAIGNMGQPNQTATLLLWGVVAGLWGITRKQVGLKVFSVYACFLMFGVALTGSRAAVIGVVLLVLFVVVWRKKWTTDRLAAIMVALFCGFLFFLQILPIVFDFLFGHSMDLAWERKSNVRPAIAVMFLDAGLLKPWFGWGWSDLSVAQLAVIDRHPAVSGLVVSHSHNLFIDLILWVGYPLGVLLSGVLIFWMISRAFSIKTESQAVVFMALIVVGNHAMFELPLHYAYFLLPAGLMIGILEGRSQAKPIFSLARQWVACVVIGFGAILSIIISDYFRIESSFSAMRFESARIGRGAYEVGDPPNVFVLNQLSDLVDLGRLRLDGYISNDELKKIEDVVKKYPSTPNLLKLISALAISGKSMEVEYWMRTANATLDRKQAALIQEVWRQGGQSNDYMKTYPWVRGED